jgi:hypothetical protein
MAERRASHTATLLPDGRVLIAGGFKKGADGRSQIYFRTAELFDPRTKKFSSTGEMTYSRAGHSASILANGLVLVAGGYGEMGILSSAELYDPATGTFTPIGSMRVRRGGFTATSLIDGRVLFCGGGDADATDAAELFDPAGKKFVPTGTMTAPRMGHTATLIPGGMVLLVGGWARRTAVLASAEMYDPATGRFRQVGSMAGPRYKHGAASVGQGNVLVIGGSDERDWRAKFATVEQYDLPTGKFVRGVDLREPRFKLPHAVVTLADGSIFVAGGARALEILAPARDTSSVVGYLDAAYYFSTATALGNGSVLIAGGYDDQLRATNNAWLWRP